jgi:hypothetical protein
MAVTNLGGGKFKIFHKEVEAPNAEAEALRGFSPSTESALSGYLGSSMHGSAFKQLRAFVKNSDNEWLRLQLAEIDAKLAAIAEDAKLAESLSNAESVVRDADLTPDARNRRAQVVLSLVLERVHRMHGTVVAGVQADLHDAINLVGMALAPELSGNELVRELRAQEIRRAVFDAAKGDRAALVSDLGNRAALEGLLAVESCPLGRVVEPEILSQAKRSALASMGVDFLLTQVESRRDVLVSVASRCDMIEELIANFLRSHGIKPTAPVAWTKAIAADIEDTQNFI